MVSASLQRQLKELRGQLRVQQSQMTQQQSQQLQPSLAAARREDRLCKKRSPLRVSLSGVQISD